MMNLPNGYRWANEYETEMRWNEALMILVHDTEYPEHADVALPVSVPVVVDLTNGDPTTPYLCTDEFDEHGSHDDECFMLYERMGADYYDGFDGPADIEYHNYLWGDKI